MFPPSAQAQESLPEQGIVLPDESTILLGESSPDIPAPAGGSSIFVVLRMVLVLGLAALAIYGVVFFIKRIARPREYPDPYLKVLARHSLGSDSYVAVVSVGAKAWLIGGGTGSVNLISEIEDTETLETMLLDDARKIAESGTRGFIDFRSFFRRLKGKPGPYRQDMDGDISGNHAQTLRRQQERLRGL